MKKNLRMVTWLMLVWLLPLGVSAANYPTLSSQCTVWSDLVCDAPFDSMRETVDTKLQGFWNSFAWWNQTASEIQKKQVVLQSLLDKIDSIKDNASNTTTKWIIESVERTVREQWLPELAQKNNVSYITDVDGLEIALCDSATWEICVRVTNNNTETNEVMITAVDTIDFNGKPICSIDTSTQAAQILNETSMNVLVQWNISQDFYFTVENSQSYMGCMTISAPDNTQKRKIIMYDL